jgi:hypothetical protein
MNHNKEKNEKCYYSECSFIVDVVTGKLICKNCYRILSSYSSLRKELSKKGLYDHEIESTINILKKSKKNLKKCF